MLLIFPLLTFSKIVDIVIDLGSIIISIPILLSKEVYELLLTNVIQFWAPALLASREDSIFTSSSSVTAIKLPALEILTSSKILVSKASPLITVTVFRFVAKNFERSLLYSISFVVTFLSSSSIRLDNENPIFPPPTITTLWDSVSSDSSSDANVAPCIPSLPVLAPTIKTGFPSPSAVALTTLS